MPLTGDGYFAGEYPGGTTTVEGAPVSATVLVYQRDSGQLIAQTESSQSGEWIVTGVDLSKAHDIVGRKEGFNDVIVSNVMPTSMVEITYTGEVLPNETFTRAVGFLELVGGIPPYSVAAETPLPAGLFPVMSGRNLIIDGATEDDEVANFDVKVTSSNGAEKIIPLQLVVGFKAPQNFKAETVVVDDVFSVMLTWEVTNTTQQVKVYRSETPFDMDYLPEPIATLSGTSTTYTDDDVIEDDYFYYMVAAVCEQYELRSNVIAGDVRTADPHWDKVVALLHFDGVDNSTTFSDSKGRVWTSAAGAKIVTDYFRFGGSSALFNEGGRIYTVPTADFAFGTGDYTVEAWVRVGAPPWGGVNNDRLVFGGFGFHPDMVFFLTNNANQPAMWDGSVQHTSSIAVSVDQWTHVAWSRVAGMLRIFVGGVQGYSGTQGTNFASQDTAYVGAVPGSRSFNGRMDELRITKGIARYTENFTPPTEPFPNF